MPSAYICYKNCFVCQEEYQRQQGVKHATEEHVRPKGEDTEERGRTEGDRGKKKGGSKKHQFLFFIKGYKISKTKVQLEDNDKIRSWVQNRILALVYFTAAHFHAIQRG